MNKKKYYKKKDATEKADPLVESNERLIACMQEAKDNNVKYKKGWFVCNEFPYNMLTGKEYGGKNVINLLSYGFADPRFIPIGEAAKLFKETNGEVRIKKGEKACVIFYSEPKTAGTGEFDDNGDEKTKSWMMTKTHYGFNISQMDGYETLDTLYPRVSKPPMNDIQESEFVREIAQAMIKDGLTIREHAIGQAYYQPSIDTVCLPDAARFETQALYNRTKLHEIGHSLGHSSRCNRDQTGGAGTMEYAYEELVAEIFSFYMGMKTGTGYDSRTHDNHGAYLNHWLGVMTSDSEDAKKYFLGAASKASHSYSYAMKKVEEMKESQKTSQEVGQENAKAVEPIIEKGGFEKPPVQPKAKPSQMSM